MLKAINIKILPLILLFGFAGLVLLLAVSAGRGNVAFEPAQNNISSPATLKSGDSSASNGDYVEFGDSQQPPISGNAPWAAGLAEAQADANGASVKVELPRGELGAPTDLPVISPPSDVATFSSTGVNNEPTWSVLRNYNAYEEGSVIDFGESMVITNGHTLTGVLIQISDNVTFTVRSVLRGQTPQDPVGTLVNATITNPNGNRHGTVIRNTNCTRCIVTGVQNDFYQSWFGVTSKQQDSYWEAADNAFIGVGPHMDGYQGGEGGIAIIERLVINWNSVGERIDTTSPLLNGDTAGATIDDVLILNPAGSYEPIILNGRGEQNIGAVQVIGRVGKWLGDGQSAPRSLVRGSIIPDPLYNDVSPSIPDWYCDLPWNPCS